MQKRVIPIITVGIGSWALILNFLAFFGVTSTSFIAPWRWKLLEGAGSWKASDPQLLQIFVHPETYVYVRATPELCPSVTA